MTPTEEEAELARVIYEIDPYYRHEVGGSGRHIRVKVLNLDDAPWYIRARAICVAGRILAAGYVKRNDALEEAAKAVERIARERGWSGAKALGKLGIASATIRALKAKT